MSTGPSPIVPFLLVVTLGLIVHGQSLKNSVSSLFNAEQAAFDFVLVIPLLALLLVYFSSKSMVVPLSLILVTYMVSKMVLGPLLLIFIIYLACFFFPPPSRESYNSIDCRPVRRSTASEQSRIAQQSTASRTRSTASRRSRKATLFPRKIPSSPFNAHFYCSPSLSYSLSLLQLKLRPLSFAIRHSSEMD